MFQRSGAAALKYDLHNTLRLLQALDNPHQKVRTIHIAGTNGKGSIAHMLAAVLQQAGYRTGLYTSPHLKHFTERIRLNGRQVGGDFVSAFVTRHRPLIEEVNPSFFEITFAMAMQYFHEQQVEVAVIETGMGGRLDSTNVVQPLLSIITNISLDHQQFLGATLPAIAAEKAGIIKPGVPVLISEKQPEVAHVFANRAAELQAPLYYAEDLLHIEQAAGGRYNVIAGGQVYLEGLLTDLRGPYQRQNLTGALAALQLLDSQAGFSIGEEAICQGVANVVGLTGLKGRWQLIGERPRQLADTAHNEAGLQVVLAALHQEKYRQLYMVWGMVQDKDAGRLLGMLPRQAHYYFVQPQIPRALPVAQLQQLAASQGLQGQAYDTVAAGLQAARQKAREDDLIFVGGSTFVVAEIDDL